MALRIPPKTKQDSKDSTAALQAASAPKAEDVSVEAGEDGLEAGTVQEVLQSFATRLAALEPGGE